MAANVAEAVAQETIDNIADETDVYEKYLAEEYVGEGEIYDNDVYESDDDDKEKDADDMAESMADTILQDPDFHWHWDDYRQMFEEAVVVRSIALKSLLSLN